MKTVLEQRNCSAEEGLRREIQSALPETDTPVVMNLIEGEMRNDLPGTLDTDVKVTIVKSGFIQSFKTPTLSDFNTEKCKVIYQGGETSRNTRKTMKRVFATSSFGPSKKSMQSCIFMKGKYDDEDEEEFWFGKTMLFFRLSCVEKEYRKEFALVRFFTCTPPQDDIDKILDCVCLRWETEDGIDHSSSMVKNKDTILAGEQYGLIPFQSICGTCHVIRGNYGIYPYTQQLPWTHHRFYVNRFHP